jgi:hypothetical protein
VFNIQNVLIQSNLNICDHLSQTLDFNKLNSSCVYIENNVNHIKYLGLFINLQLKWKKHIDYLVNLISTFFLHLL